MGVDVNGGPHHVVGLTTWCRSAHHPQPSPPPVGAALGIITYQGHISQVNASHDLLSK